MSVRSFALSIFFLFLLFPGFVCTVCADMEKADKALKDSDFETAYKEYLAEARKGNAKAQGVLGFLYYSGLGVDEN